jgi:hypothetical protein
MDVRLAMTMEVDRSVCQRAIWFDGICIALRFPKLGFKYRGKLRRVTSDVWIQLSTRLLEKKTVA